MPKGKRSIRVGGDVRNSTLIAGDDNIVTIKYEGPPPLPPAEVVRLLAGYRTRMLEDTRYVNLRGIPLPRGRDGRPMPLQVLLDKVYIRIQATTEKLRRAQEEAEERSLSGQLRDENAAQSKRATPDTGVSGVFSWLRGESKSQSAPRDILSTLHTLGEYFYRRGEVYEAAQRPEPVDPEEALKKHKRLVVLGVPGAGKSTLLRYLARRAAESSDHFVPVPVSLRDYATALAGDSTLALSEFALRMASAGDTTLRQALEDEIKNGRVFWLVDALDEARGWAANAARQAGQLPGQLILTSRPVGYVSTGLESLPHFEVLPLMPENVDEFLRSWFGLLAAQRMADEEWTTARVAWLKKQLEARPRIRTLTRNPLLLTFLVVLAGEESLQDLPDQRADLYRRYIEELLDSWETERRPKGGAEGQPAFSLGSFQGQQARQMALQGFYYLGWSLHLAYYGGKPQKPPTRDVLIKTLADYLQADGEKDARSLAVDILEFWQEAGLLETWHLDGDDYLAFRHLTFQEYAAAWGISQAWKRDSKRAWKFLRPRLHHYAWREPILLLVGLMEQKCLNDLAHYLLCGASSYEGSLYRDLRLAGELLAEGAILDEEQRILHKLGKRTWPLFSYLPTFVILVLLLCLPINLFIPDIPVNALSTSEKLMFYAYLMLVVLPGLFYILVVPFSPLVYSLLMLPGRIWNLVPDRGSLMPIFAQIGSRALPYLIQALDDDYPPDVKQSAIDAFGHCNIQLSSHLLLDIRWHTSTAVKTLRYIRDAQAIPELIRVVQRRDNDVSRIVTKKPKSRVSVLVQAVQIVPLEMQIKSAINTLGVIGDARAVPHLVRVLRGSYYYGDDTRRAAAEALGKIGDTQAIHQLTQHLRDKNAEVCQAVVKALGHIGLQSLPYIIPVLQHPIRDLRLAAVEALGRIGGIEVIPVNERIYNAKFALEKNLDKIGVMEIIPHLIQALQDRDAAVRRAAIETLGQIGDPQAVPHLIQALQDRDAAVRRAAIETLGQIGDPQAVPHLIQALQDEDATVCRDAIETLGQIGDPQAVSHLIQVLQRGDYFLGRYAAKSLGKIGDVRAVPYLIQALNNGNVPNIAEALGDIGDRQAVPHLIRALQEDWRHRDISGAAKALGKIGDLQALPSLIRISQDRHIFDDDSSSHQVVVEAIQQIFTHQSFPYLVQVFQDSDTDMRQAAVGALGEIGDTRVIPYLIQATRDRNRDVRSNAIKALGKTGSVQAVPGLTRGLWDQHPSIRRDSAIHLKEIAHKITDIQTGRHIMHILWWRLSEDHAPLSLLVRAVFCQAMEQVVNRVSVLELEAREWDDPLGPLNC